MLLSRLWIRVLFVDRKHRRPLLKVRVYVFRKWFSHQISALDSAPASLRTLAATGERNSTFILVEQTLTPTPACYTTTRLD